jgi:small subunit ribosomal protein S6
MRPYEVMLILEGTADENTVQSNVTKITDLVTAGKGNVGQVSKWGRRRFAYELKHRWEGNYSLIEFSAEPQTIADLDRMLLLSDEVVRHKIIRLPESVAGRKSPAEIPELSDSEESSSAEKEETK